MAVYPPLPSPAHRSVQLILRPLYTCSSEVTYELLPAMVLTALLRNGIRTRPPSTGRSSFRTGPAWSVRLFICLCLWITWRSDGRNYRIRKVDHRMSFCFAVVIGCDALNRVKHRDLCVPCMFRRRLTACYGPLLFLTGGDVLFALFRQG